MHIICFCIVVFSAFLFLQFATAYTLQREYWYFW